MRKRKGVRRAGIRRAGRLPSAAGSLTRLAYAAAKAAGVAPGPLLKQAGLTVQRIEDPKARIDVRSQIEFLNLAAAKLNDEFLGLRLAGVPDLRELGLLYYALASSDTLIDALQRAARYSSIVNEGAVQRCIDGRYVGMSLHYTGVSRHLDRHQAEFWMAILVRACRQLTGLRLLPIRVRFSHSREKRCAELSEFFGHAVEFGAEVDEILFAKRVAQLPLVGADPFLHKLLIAYCEEALATHPRDRGSFRSKVENAIVPLLPHGKAQAGEIARRLAMSQRTLARRLRQETLSYSELLEDLRSDLAHRYLADGDLRISQIAWLLGYREVGAFSHAFKRWTGRTPSQARARASR